MAAPAPSLPGFRRWPDPEVATGRVRGLGLALTLLGIGFAPPAASQIKASASLESDYRLRGISLTDGRPVVSLNLAYDHPSGVYLGGSAMAQEAAQNMGGSGLKALSRVAYIGYAATWGAGQSWDIGVTDDQLSIYGSRKLSFHYTELHLGFSKDQFSAHIAYSPHYFIKGSQTVYLDVNDAIRLNADWRLFGHVGMLAPLSGPLWRQGRRERFDVQAGVSRQFSACELHATWTASFPGPRSAATASRPGLAVGATLFF